ncbi:hydrolase 1, exosortase A system-associated [Sphingomonas sp. G-3-2-10]|uniref:hydrolase 1, exosortase A system-associated n=1 Tax=Sphingomonas sp. G-3-2-10 TaxID=2728838 RepID=UPI00146C6523|nr:hydrolase 1, exosortase A system-associated [Sphingomonas sp. G-3-2-10]NML04562.1 hydrolase 1, exosortase A system-associated [Sphingomonas sp. G-3-2-10]
MRRLIEFPCAGETLAGTIDEGAGAAGLLIVSGGNEVRMGAHRGMALLAARVAGELGAPVFRYDRRGIGDSTGANGGFETSAEDIAAAVAAFRAEASHLTRIVAFGNCDAATALALFGPGAGVDTLLLANPWVIEATDDLPPAAAIRARYAERLRDPKEWLRLIRGGVNIGKLIKGLLKASKSSSQIPAGLAARLAASLGRHGGATTILIAARDNTAIAFMEAWNSAAFGAARKRVRLVELVSDSHSFASVEDKDWLFERVRETLA